MKAKRFLTISLSLILVLAMMLPCFGTVGATGEFPFGTVLVDFESDTAGINSNSGLTFTQSTDNASTGSNSMMISSDSQVGWAHVSFTLGTALGATGSDVLDTKYIGFHIKANKGGTAAGENTVLLQDFEISGQNWWQHVTNANYWIMEDGSDDWIQKTMQGSGVVLTGEFSGYVLLDIKNFKQNHEIAGTNADIFSAGYPNFLKFHFDGIGGDRGAAYIDSVFYATEDLLAPKDTAKTFPLNGTVTADFEYGVDGVTGHGKEVTSSSKNVSSGSKSVMINAETQQGWSRVDFVIGNRLGAEGSDALNAKYIGFHYKAPKGGTAAGENTHMLQDVGIYGAGDTTNYYAQKFNTNYWLLTDGTDEWQEKTMQGSGVVVPGSFSGYVLLPIENFCFGGQDGAAATGATLFAADTTNGIKFHFNEIGGEKGAAYVDSFFYATDDITAGPEVTADILTGASVRYGQPTGLRFISNIEGLDTVRNVGATYKAYTLIAPIDYVNAAADFTPQALEAAGKTYLNIELTAGSYVDDGSIYQEGATLFNAAIVNIKPGNYNREFAARSYVIITYASGATETIYSDFSATDNVRSVKNVAQACLDTNDYDNDRQKAILEGFVG